MCRYYPSIGPSLQVNNSFLQFMEHKKYLFDVILPSWPKVYPFFDVRILLVSPKVCRFQVGSFNYDITKIVFKDEFVAESSAIK